MPPSPGNADPAPDDYVETSERWIQSVLRILEEEETLTDQEREYARDILRRAGASLRVEDDLRQQGAIERAYPAEPGKLALIFL
ncbi:MAG TPA: hypothetical protein VFA07_18250 [Chthonomonadaceae bacterium]|nr:hypothetical protein [Chthonomonadaceae bacterium]